MNPISDSELRFDLYSFFKNKGIAYLESANQLIIECPDCLANKLYINSVNKLFVCFKCGIKGKLFKLLLMVTGEDKKSVYKLINDSFNLPKFGSFMNLSLLKSRENCFSCDGDNDDLDDFSYPISYLDEDELIGSYLINRGISLEMVKKFNLRYAANMRRLIFPIYENGLNIGWTGRDITEVSDRKYFNSNGLKKQNFFYGCENINDVESIMLVEGPIDALKAHRHNAFAMMGKFLSKAQRNLLISAPKLKKIYLGLDPNAIVDAYKISKMLDGFFEVYFVNYPKGYRGDIGDMTENEVDEIVNDAFVFKIKKQLNMEILNT